MSSKQNMSRDPVKRAARRRAQRDAVARGAVINEREQSGISASQAAHASGAKARKKAREGFDKLEEPGHA